MPKVCGRAVPECRQQGFVDGLFKSEDFGDAKSLLHFLGIESLKAFDTLPQPRDANALLFNCEDRRLELARWDRTAGHVVYSGCAKGPYNLIRSTSFCVGRFFVRS